MEIKENRSLGISVVAPGSTRSPRSLVSYLFSTGNTYHTNERSTTPPSLGGGQGNNELGMIDEQLSLSGRSGNDDLSFSS